MKITREENEALIDALARLLYVPPYDPGTMVTIQDMADRLKVSEDVARSELEKLEKAGQLQRLEVRLTNGRRATAYADPG